MTLMHQPHKERETKMEHWRVRERIKMRRLNDYATALEHRERVLLQALSDLSRGLGIKQGDGSSWDSAMQALAAKTIRDVATMRVPERPIVTV